MNIKVLDRKKLLNVFCGALLLVAIAGFLYLRSDHLSSEDGFYHFRHADLYRINGLGMSEFPWIAYSVIRIFGSDLWYGFHVILIPFTWIGDPVIGMRVAGIAVTAISLFLIVEAFRRLGIRHRLLWAAAFLFSSPFITFRMAMLRPHVLTTGLAVLFFACAVAGSVAGVFVTSFAIAWVHASLFWVPCLIFGVVAAFRLFCERTIDWRSGVALAAGLVAGLSLRPNPIGIVKAVYIQVVQLMVEKLNGVPLNFGLELYPLPVANLWIFGSFLIVWLGAIGAVALVLWNRGMRMALTSAERVAIGAGGVVSALFLGMTLTVAERSFDFWVALGIVFMALVAAVVSGAARYRRHIAATTIGIFAITAAFSIYEQGRYLETIGWQSDQFRGAAEWLATHAATGAIVFNVSWDYFPELFFWNPGGRYIGGFDPIFQYAYDPNLYWKAYYLETGKTTDKTCATTFCTEAELDDTYTILKEDFSASYVVLAKLADAPLYAYFKSDSRYAISYEDSYAAVVEVR